MDRCHCLNRLLRTWRWESIQLLNGILVVVTVVHHLSHNVTQKQPFSSTPAEQFVIAYWTHYCGKSRIILARARCWTVEKSYCLSVFVWLYECRDRMKLNTSNMCSQATECMAAFYLLMPINWWCTAFSKNCNDLQAIGQGVALLSGQFVNGRSWIAVEQIDKQRHLFQLQTPTVHVTTYRLQTDYQGFLGDKAIHLATWRRPWKPGIDAGLSRYRNGTVQLKNTFEEFSRTLYAEKFTTIASLLCTGHWAAGVAVGCSELKLPIARWKMLQS